MGAGQLDRRVQFMEPVKVDDGFQETETFEAIGSPVWCSKTDVSDAERAVAGWLEATMVSRFVVRSSAFTRALTPKNRLVCDGVDFDITGIKEIGQREDLEITASAVST
ncbi:phage head-tail adapter protein [Thioclava dalianensis]|uniref:Phage head-tail adapter protein n=1 Tax=Thioclava dalianensis TaxID=1185766 RepID=A0A074T9P9_9RHOB|nr:phage head-tail adapter protein [Thioclava dalianensis]